MRGVPRAVGAVWRCLADDRPHWTDIPRRGIDRARTAASRCGTSPRFGAVVAAHNGAKPHPRRRCAGRVDGALAGATHARVYATSELLGFKHNTHPATEENPACRDVFKLSDGARSYDRLDHDQEPRGGSPRPRPFRYMTDLLQWCGA